MATRPISLEYCSLATQRKGCGGLIEDLARKVEDKYVTTVTTRYNLGRYVPGHDAEVVVTRTVPGIPTEQDHMTFRTVLENMCQEILGDDSTQPKLEVVLLADPDYHE